LQKKIQYIAYHESGHAVAHFLAGIRFKFVTIKPVETEDEYGERILGYVMYDKPIYDEISNSRTKLYPVEFINYVRLDFTNLAGMVSEKIYHHGSYDFTAAKDNLELWKNNILDDLPEPLNSKYQDFIFEYTYQVLQLRVNWSCITAVAEALLNYETLSYNQVRSVLKENLARLQGK
jgi:hypothetical protein